MKRLTGLIAMLLAADLAMAAPASDVPIPREYFGLHIHRADQGTAWPKVPFGSWRLWDAYVTWADMEPKQGQWDFSRLDRYVAMAKLTNVDILLPLANTPSWAAARPAEKSGYKSGNASEPARIDDWRNYVKTVGERYRGKIFNYEIWNEPNIKHHYSGGVQKLVDLTCEAKKILGEIDPKIRVVSPAATSGGRDHLGYLSEFLSLGGAKCIDVVGHHFYTPNTPPEAIVQMIRDVRKVMVRNGVGDLPVWNTESGYWIENGDGTPDHAMVAKGGWKKLARNDESGEYLKRAFMLARSEGIARFYWYSWDSKYGLGMIEPSSGQPKPMTNSWREVAEDLIGATDFRCSESTVEWSCDFKKKSGELVRRNWSK